MAAASSSPSIMWFRRDLRAGDNPALLAACAEAGDAGVLPLFVLDPALWRPAGPSRRGYLVASLHELAEALEGHLTIREGDPVTRLVEVAEEISARTVHVAADFGPYGARRDTAVEKALAERGIELRRLGSPYAVAPGRIIKADGTPYHVFTPFSRAWLEHGWRAPVDSPRGATWLSLEGSPLPEIDLPEGLSLPRAGEVAALERWRQFLGDRLAGYDEARDLPGVHGTSGMSVHLKWGEVHPRTLLADLASVGSKDAASYRTELAWREFYADVLWHRPQSAREYLRPELARMEYDEPGTAFTAWQQGRTGYPIVDAGMRQLRAIGWMHNRVRMIVASFLVKDMHIEWQHGARHFMHWLVDGDLASNQHGWQWVAGSGTDAAPYFRVFNPTTQSKKFDPEGAYVRRGVDELRGVDQRYLHEPHTDPAGPPPGYPAPMLDHAAERREALARLERTKR